jgi:Tfp pilus assembly protein FimV
VLTVVTVVVVVQEIAGLVGGSSASSPAPAAVVPPVPTSSTDLTWVVRPGDTLWSIAQSMQPTGNSTDLLMQLHKAYANTPLLPGQVLTVRP